MELNETTLFITEFIYFSNRTIDIKYVDQEKQHIFSCKHENTLKSIFSESDERTIIHIVCRYGVLFLLYFSKPRAVAY